MKQKNIKVGIMSREEFKLRTIAIAKGEYKPRKDEPKIWFESIQSFSQVLSDDNRMLLHIIDERQPKSLRELGEMTGRKKSNLSRTLHTMEGYGIVDLVRLHTRELVPHVKATRFELEIGLPEKCAFCSCREIEVSPPVTGAVGDRSQTFSPKTQTWVKRDSDTGQFMDQKADGTAFKIGLTPRKPSAPHRRSG